MKIVSGIIMLIGLIMGFGVLSTANGAPQEAIALVPIVGGYVTGRMLENFAGTSESKTIKKILEKLNEK